MVTYPFALIHFPFLAHWPGSGFDWFSLVFVLVEASRDMSRQENASIIAGISCWTHCWVTGSVRLMLRLELG